jgi:hypothetical protein
MSVFPARDPAAAGRYDRGAWQDSEYAKPTPQRESGAGGRVLPRGKGKRRAEGPSAAAMTDTRLRSRPVRLRRTGTADTHN